MSSTPFENLPLPPDQCSGGAVLARLIDAIGYRYYLATDGLSDKEFHFRPIEGSMNMQELLDHMYKVLNWAYKAFDKDAEWHPGLETLEDYRNTTLAVCVSFKQRLLEMSEEEIAATSVYLKRMDTHYSFWYLINGPLSDVLTHIGQINSWRRMAGNPVPKVSPFTGEPY